MKIWKTLNRHKIIITFNDCLALNLNLWKSFFNYPDTIFRYRRVKKRVIF